MPKPGKTTKSSRTARKNVIVDFNTYKIRAITKSLCEKYHVDKAHIDPLINHIIKRHKNITPNQIHNELDMFMDIKRAQGRI